MRFLADAMLGKLAKWLRILGYDTILMSSDLDDDSILSLTGKDRVLITRDKELALRARKRGIICLVVPEDHAEALAVISDRLGIILRIYPSKTRCPFCNLPMTRVRKSELKNLPREVIKSNNLFLKCEKCGNVYWFATHYWQMLGTLRRARATKIKLVRRK